MESLECSECGVGYFGTPNNINSCMAGVIGISGSKLLYQGAKPRWSGGEVNIGSTYYSGFNLNPARRTLNVSNSCNSGCAVSE